MKLNAEQQTWLDKLKETWEDVEFYEDERKEYCVSFSIERDFYAFSIRESFAIWQFYIYDAPSLTKSMLTKVLSFFEKLAKSQGKVLFIVESHLDWRIDNTNEFLEKKNYEVIKNNNNLQYLFNSWDFKKLYMKKNQKKQFETHMKFASSFNDTVEYMMERMAGMEMMEDNSSYIEFSYLDHPFSMELLYQSSQVIVEIKDWKTHKMTQHIIQKPEKMMNIVVDTFKEIREKQKIRRLFNRNDRYYNAMINNILGLSKEDALYESFYQELRKWYHPIEIEEISFEYQGKHDLPTKEISPRSHVFKLKDTLFYIDRDNQIIESMKSEENNSAFSSLIIEKTKKKIQESLQELDIL